MTYVVQYSGGLGSWGAAKLLADEHGAENVHLLFADTQMEDEDLYRFLHEGADALGCLLTTISDGRNVWEVFEDERYLGNSRIDPCSKILKRELLRKHIENNYNYEQDVVALGIDWTEKHRLDKALSRWEPWNVIAPLVDNPEITKAHLFNWLRDYNIDPPRLYDMGFPHNNCGGFCIKAGQAHFKLLYEKMPERFMYHAQKEQEMRDLLGKDVSILRRQRNGKRHNLTLLELKEEIDAQTDETDPFDLGGCGCAID